MTSRFTFDCVFYHVGDLDRAIRFYVEALGLPLSSRDAVARFHVDGVLVELVPASDPQLLSGRGNARLTLRVPEIGEAVAELRARGIRVTDPRRVEGGFLASFWDPDDNELVLWQHATAAGSVPGAGSQGA